MHSGDLGYLDDDGYLYLVDRKKDLIVRGPQHLVHRVGPDPDVVEAAVLGLPHRAGPGRRGRGPPATGRLTDLAAALQFLADRLADYKRPRLLTVVHDPLPRNAMGKLDKKVLRARVAPAP